MWIDFEGIDGSGKTTLSLRVARRLRELGRRVHHVRENGSFRSALANRLRDVTRSPEHALICPETELLVLAAREAQVIAEDIRPALERGDVVITDRGLHSHEVLACAVRGLPRSRVDAVIRCASGGLRPDAVVFVDTDPDIARLRRRLRKIRERRGSTGGRKGLLGLSLAHRSRRGFLAMAAREPSRWCVLDNTWASPADGELAALRALAPRLGVAPPEAPALPAPLRLQPADGLAAWPERFFEFLEALRMRDAGLALLYAAGLEDPRVHAFRHAALEAHGDVVVWSLTGRGTPDAWELRRAAVASHPYAVVRSLRGLDVEDAWALRARFADEEPEAVASSLAGLDGERAYRLRERLWGRCPQEVLRSLGGLDDARAWAFRRHALDMPPAAALAESLEGLESDEAWELRERLRAEFPVAVLRSLKRIHDPRAWPLREAMAAGAPSAVLDTLKGLEGPAADRLRDQLAGDHPEETAESLSGLEDRQAWRRRHDLMEEAPAGVISSLYGLQRDPLAWSFVENSVGRSGGRPRTVRKAVVFLQRAAADREMAS